MNVLLRVAAAAAAAATTACGSGSPPVRHHTLLAAPAASAPAAASVPWRLLPVGVPAQVDRPQFVVHAADGTLAVLEQERWIAPLPDEIGAALADGLARRLGPSAATGPAWRLRVDVQRMESLPGRVARLEVVWSVQPPGATDPQPPCAATFEQPVGAGYAALAAGHRAALAALAERLAAVAAGRTAGCGDRAR